MAEPMEFEVSRKKNILPFTHMSLVIANLLLQKSYENLVYSFDFLYTFLNLSHWLPGNHCIAQSA